MSRIHLSVPHLGTLEQEHVREAFETNWVSTVGANLERFEADFSVRMGGLPCVALSSGTAALPRAKAKNHRGIIFVFIFFFSPGRPPKRRPGAR